MTNSKQNQFEPFLDLGLNTYQSKLNRLYKNRLSKNINKNLKVKKELDSKLKVFKNEQIEIQLILFLFLNITSEIENILKIEKLYQQYYRNYSSAKTAEDQETQILNFSLQLGSTKRQVSEDKKSFSRYFGHDAVIERYNKKLQKFEKNIKYYLERSSFIAQKIFINKNENEQKILWNELGCEAVFTECITLSNESNSFKQKTVLSILHIVKSIPAQNLQSLFSLDLKKELLKFCLMPNTDVWLTSNAFFVCVQAFPEAFNNIIETHLHPRTGKEESEHMFIRRRLIDAMSKYLYRAPEWLSYYKIFAKDSKPFVRQGVAKNLKFINSEDIFIELIEALIFNEDEPGVKAQCILAFKEIPFDDVRWTHCKSTLLRVLEQEKDSYVLRVCFSVFQNIISKCVERGQSSQMMPFYLDMVDSLAFIKSNNEDPAVRKWASWTLEITRSSLDSNSKELSKIFTDSFLSTNYGGFFLIKTPGLLKTQLNDFIRGLAFICQEDWGLDIEIKEGKNSTIKYLKAYKGFRFRNSLWRFWHEIRNPRPDKRQAFNHLNARHYTGSYRVPSGILAEVSQTMVPGEPLLDHLEQSYRPYLPLLDDFISLVRPFRKTNETILFSAEGQVYIQAPSKKMERIKAHIKLAHNYSKYSIVRNWSEKLSSPPNSYIKIMQDMGFNIVFKEYLYNDIGSNDLVTRFFE